MKQNIKNLFSKPKTAISLALVIAIAAGIFFTISQNNTRADYFAKITSQQESTNSTTTAQRLTLAFPVGGRIKAVSVKNGDSVKAGAVLASLDSENALGAVNQAKGAYNAALTNYEKLINGASDSDIQIAKVALNNAKNNYATIISQQKNLVANALSGLHNAGLSALPITNGVNIPSPIISGTYNNTEEGTYTIVFHPTSNGFYFSYSGLEKGTGSIETLAVPVGTRGLFIQLPNNFKADTNDTWTISIPNAQSLNYLTYYNAYQSALQNQSLSIASAQGVIDSAQATLDQKVAGTRSEDLKIAQAQVESTKGALQIAEGAYNNTLIKAPTDGTVTSVSITAGQITTANTPAIELLTK